MSSAICDEQVEVAVIVIVRDTDSASSSQILGGSIANIGNSDKLAVLVLQQDIGSIANTGTASQIGINIHVVVKIANRDGATGHSFGKTHVFHLECAIASRQDDWNITDILIPQHPSI